MVKKLQKVRIQKGYSVRELAEEVGVHYSLISYWENGKRNPKSSNKEMLEHGLGVPHYKLLEEDKGEDNDNE